MIEWIKTNNKKLIMFALTVVSIVFLFLPVFGSCMGNGEGTKLVVKVWSFMEFSPLGLVVVCVPLLIMALYCSNLSGEVKTVCLFAFVVITLIGINHGSIASYQWLRDVTDSYVKIYGGNAYYTIALLLEVAFFYTCERNEIL